MRLDQGSKMVEDSNSTVEERENSSTSSPTYREYCSKKEYTAARLALSELNQPDSMHLLRGMLFSCGSDTYGIPSLNLNAMNVSMTDTTKSQKIVTTLSETCVAESTQDAHPTSLAIRVQKRDVLDSPRVDIETSLIDFVCHDNAEALVCLLRKILQVSSAEEKVLVRKAEDFQAVLGFWFPHRLLHLACKLDSVACAQALMGGVAGLSSPVNAVDDNGKTALHHAASNLSTRCIELLLQKRAKPDISSNDGCTPLKLALQNKRWPSDLQTRSAAEIIEFFRTEDLDIIKLLTCHTKGVLRLACSLACDGHSPALTALIIAVGNSLLGEDHKYESFLDLVVGKALSRGTGHSDSQKNCTRTSDSNESESEKHKFSVLKCLEIIVCLKGELEKSSSHPECQPLKLKPSALLRAAQAGDETVLKILLIDRTYIHDTDADGNTALHWCLKTTKGLRVIWQLVTLGSAVGVRNKLGYTPVHVAAGQGHLQALQLLLAQDPSAVHIAAVTRETPLFLAVKNNHIDCVKLLLQFGSNSQALNLRRQRPVDFANSQDMRVLLSEYGTSSSGKLKKIPDSKFFSTTMQRHQTQAVQGLSNLENGPTIENIDKFINSQDDPDESNWLLKAQHAKTALCRYHMMPGGCARGEGCFYAHSEQELRPEVQVKTKATDAASNQKKIFVGGLSPSIGSDDLKDCFEAEFGPVEEAIVMSTQTGGHIQSRGFGFVTFVKEASCVAAVRQHYLIIYGKRVEIKAAFQPPKRANEDMLDIHSPNPPRLLSHAQDTTKDVISCSIMSKGETFIVQKGEAAASTNDTVNTSLSHPSPCHPPWLPVFKKWLPTFLSAASTRQHGGEFYPLSSVKADFRATCGMELDHTALGFSKLSDFLRTMPELCRMKIVPVGRGPATHVVLQVRQQQNLIPKPPQTMTATKILASSLVHEGRTYAAAASQNIATLAGDDTGVQKTSENSVPMKPQPLIDNSGPNHSAEYNTHDFSAGSSVYTGQQTCTVSNDSCLPLMSDRKEPHQTLIEKVPTVEVCKTWEQEISGNNPALRYLQPQLANAPMTHDSSHLDTPATQPPQQQNLLSFLDVYHNPYMEHAIPSSPFQNRAMPTYKQGAVSLYNPWNFNVFEGCRNLIQQMNLAATGEESPQSSLTSDDSLDSPFRFTETPPMPCVICGDKAAVWVALPCAHKAICSLCKHQLHKNQSLQQCFVCQGRTRDWMAQY
ncbi:hypothetical protein GOP47_0004703 [Adiantum capillus-veneris]|uniref:Uncharacterized protein n=1 Tax=Adiantum capillus-veneris TaxID=13818 RepID=A0A9D4ZQK1_ADICA|nr:hypothetical protein GOP47_0004703 [Adiantum capillus-veneris]